MLLSVGGLLLWRTGDIPMRYNNLREFPPQSDWTSIYPEHRGRAFAQYYDIIATGTFRLIATEINDGVESNLEIHQMNGMMMSAFDDSRMIMRDGKTYTFFDALEGFYLLFDSPSPPWDPANDTYGISFVGWGIAEFDGRELNYEKYTFESGNTDQFFFDGDVLVGFRGFSVLFDKITDTIIHILDNNVSSEVFEIPADYQEFDPDAHWDLVSDIFEGWSENEAPATLPAPTQWSPGDPWPDNIPEYRPGSITLWPDGQLEETFYLPYTLHHRAIPAIIDELVDGPEVQEWLLEVASDSERPTVMLIKAFVQRFNIQKEDFVAAVEELREIYIALDHDLTDELYELPNADIIFTFDNELISHFYRRA